MTDSEYLYNDSRVLCNRIGPIVQKVMAVDKASEDMVDKLGPIR